MPNFTTQFPIAIAIRTEFVLNDVYMKLGLPSAPHPDDLIIEAYTLGLTSHFSNGIADYFNGTPLREAYVSGHALQDGITEESADCGTHEEFMALSEEDQQQEWNEFHARCIQGDAEGMYFYHVMMGQWLQGYCGH